MNLSCIILNYNDAETTKKLVMSLRDYHSLDTIVIVDNHSTDQSALKLKELANGKVHMLSTEKNGGYGYGNNQGIRYAFEQLNATHVLIANPDVEVSEECILAMKKSFERIKKLAISTAVTLDKTGAVALSSWKLNGLLLDLFDTGLITRRLFQPLINGRPELEADLQRKPGSNMSRYANVDAVLGSFFMADCQALLDCGLYDETVFLYYEEKILGYKLKEKGYQTVLLLDQFYIHHHSVSINKTVKSILKKQALLHKSKLYYYKEYLKINRLQECLVTIFLDFIMLEIWFLTKIVGLSW